MGMIRGGLLVIVCVLLLASFIAVNVFMVLSSSLEYENIQAGFTPIAKEFADNQFGLTNNINKNLQSSVEFCKNNSEITFENGSETFVISCSIISQGSEAIINKLVDDFVSKIYYTEYNCGFFDCNSDGTKPFFLISEHSMNYFWSFFIKGLLVCVLLFVLLFFLTETKSNSLVLAGCLLIVSSLFVRFLTPIFLRIFLTPIFKSLNMDVMELFGFLISSLASVFLKFFIFGFILVGAGILWKFFSVGFKINSFFQKFGSKADSKEIEKKSK